MHFIFCLPNARFLDVLDGESLQNCKLPWETSGSEAEPKRRKQGSALLPHHHAEFLPVIALSFTHWLKGITAIKHTRWAKQEFFQRTDSGKAFVDLSLPQFLQKTG